MPNNRVSTPPTKKDCQMLNAIMKAAKQIHEEFDCLSDHVLTKRQIREQIAAIIWKRIDGSRFMTDRSSEERSRFEKWALKEGLRILRFGERYYDAETNDARAGWVAALEDRQEAAPKFMVTRFGDIHRECDACHAEGASCQPISGVPSEAAKEEL